MSTVTLPTTMDINVSLFDDHGTKTLLAGGTCFVPLLLCLRLLVMFISSCYTAGMR